MHTLSDGAGKNPRFQWRAAEEIFVCPFHARKKGVVLVVDAAVCFESFSGDTNEGLGADERKSRAAVLWN